jgi:hypothetical protein
MHTEGCLMSITPEARTGRQPSLLERMSMWGQRFDQEVQNYRRLGESLGEKGETIPLDVTLDYGVDMESLAHGAANLLSTVHVALDRFVEEFDSHPGEAAADLLAALEGKKVSRS